MQLKKRLLIIIGIMLLLAIGGKVLTDHQKVKAQKAEEEKIEAERLSVVALKKRYANIKSVEFQRSGYSKKTGVYTMYVTMTNQENEVVDFSFTFWKNRTKLGLADIVDRKVQVIGVTTNRVQVTYSNKEEDEV